MGVTQADQVDDGCCLDAFLALPADEGPRCWPWSTTALEGGQPLGITLLGP